MTTKSTGFTLIEVVTVILVISIMASVALPRYWSATGDAEMATAQILTGRMQSALALYLAQQKALPTAFSDFITTGALTTCSACTLSIQQIVGRATITNLNTATMSLTYTTSGGVAQYTIDGSQVNDTFTGF